MCRDAATRRAGQRMGPGPALGDRSATRRGSPGRATPATGASSLDFERVVYRPRRWRLPPTRPSSCHPTDGGKPKLMPSRLCRPLRQHPPGIATTSTLRLPARTQPRTSVQSCRQHPAPAHPHFALPSARRCPTAQSRPHAAARCGSSRHPRQHLHPKPAPRGLRMRPRACALPSTGARRRPLPARCCRHRPAPPAPPGTRRDERRP
mmetsp:Transcript_81399/g.264234  ORF Transcript_81399/g.264234 Transcript_81399/m.264234 type:complete len:207 (+) Transcript_81399:1165-1785(+)